MSYQETFRIELGPLPMTVDALQLALAAAETAGAPGGTAEVQQSPPGVGNHLVVVWVAEVT